MNRLVSKEAGYIIFGMLGVICFSLTPIATRAAVMDLSPLFVGIGRGAIAAVVAGLILVLLKQSWPARRYYRDILVVASCVVVLFPLMLSIGMQYVPASHAGVMLGILPLLTAVVAAIRSGEQVSLLFWLLSVLGAGLVIVFTYHQSNTGWSMADSILIFAIIIGAIGYSEGARLGKKIGSWQVICWALVFSFPLLILPFLYTILTSEFTVSNSSWVGFFYLAIISQLFGFFPWYYALSQGGTVRISQLMLFMPFMTIIFSAFLLGETVGWEEWLFSILIVLIVGLSFRVSNNKSLVKTQTANKIFKQS